MNKFVIFGIDDVYASEMVESLRRLEFEIIAGILVGEPKWGMTGIGCVLRRDEAGSELTSFKVTVPPLNPGYRKQLVEQLRELGFKRFGTVFDPTAVVASSVLTGDGVYANAGVVVGSFVHLEHHVFVNRAASIGHHTRVQEYGTIGPQVTIASNCLIGRGAFIGAGATLVPNVSVGANSVVGAGAVVIADVPDNTVVVGNPARVIKEGIAGYQDRSV